MWRCDKAGLSVYNTPCGWVGAKERREFGSPASKGRKARSNRENRERDSADEIGLRGTRQVSAGGRSEGRSRGDELAFLFSRVAEVDFQVVRCETRKWDQRRGGYEKLRGAKTGMSSDGRGQKNLPSWEVIKARGEDFP